MTDRHLLVISKVSDEGLLVVLQHTLCLPECLQTGDALLGGLLRCIDCIVHLLQQHDVMYKFRALCTLATGPRDLFPGMRRDSLIPSSSFCNAICQHVFAAMTACYEVSLELSVQALLSRAAAGALHTCICLTYLSLIGNA